MVLPEFRDIKIISGGQTGVDRAALDTAIELGLSHGGWCPAERWAEDGTIPPRYQLEETPSSRPEVRTEWNVRDSDGTLILARGALFGGTAYTVEIARRLGRPCLIVDLRCPPPLAEIRDWICRHRIRRLNVAGPRESNAPGIYQEARDFLHRLLCEGRSESRFLSPR
ncbi:MAG: putative molybdenum carrier protein [Thermoguttaceae bacterium]|nr:putative molybdenum carrier protein [Thermoguttaceae bacterium]MDW8077797.1 putative molybdenum carrier protein [Thermoguttaceae bacterium]